TWDPLDCLSAEHNRDEYEELYERACEEARRTPLDACDAWVAREASHSIYYALAVDDVLLSCACAHAEYAVTFFYELDGWKAYCGRIKDDERIAQRRLLEDIFGNPFRPVVFNATWRTPTVRALATAAYGDRLLPAGTLNPDRLATLANALEDAGC